MKHPDWYRLCRLIREWRKDRAAGAPCSRTFILWAYSRLVGVLS